MVISAVLRVIEVARPEDAVADGDVGALRAVELVGDGIRAGRDQTGAAVKVCSAVGQDAVVICYVNGIIVRRNAADVGLDYVGGRVVKEIFPCHGSRAAVQRKEHAVAVGIVFIACGKNSTGNRVIAKTLRNKTVRGGKPGDAEIGVAVRAVERHTRPGEIFVFILCVGGSVCVNRMRLAEIEIRLRD